MITQVGKSSIYVGSQDIAAQFWVKQVGWVEVAPLGENRTTKVLNDYVVMARVRPEVVGPSAIFFEACEIESFLNHLRSKGVEVAELQHLSYGKMFNLIHPDGNEWRADKAA